MAESINNAYSILGVTKRSTDKEIKAAYVNLVKKYDPEKHTDRFMQVQRAYDKLKAPKPRAKEDVYTYNIIIGEFLFLDDEKSGPDGPPSDVEVQACRSAHQSDPVNPDKKQALCRLLFCRAHYATERRQLNDAIKDWTEVLAVEPSHTRARHNLELACCMLGHSYALHGLSEEALELWERALQMNPDNTDIIHNAALAAEKADIPEKAGKYWGETVARWKLELNGDPDNEYLRHCIVEALNHHGEYVEAHQITPSTPSRTAAKPAPSGGDDKPKPMPASGGAPPQAQATAGKEAMPGSPPSKELPKSGRPRVAVPAAATEEQAPAAPSASIDRYRQIVELNPEDFDAHFTLCNKLMEANLFEDAKEELIKLARKHPKNVEVLNLLGWALLNSGQKDLAFNAWKKSLSIDPKNPNTREQMVRAHLSMGKAFRAKGLFTQALVHFKALVNLMPQSPEVHLEIGATYDMKGDVRAAALEYNRVLSLDPKNAVARKALNDLRMKR